MTVSPKFFFPQKKAPKEKLLSLEIRVCDFTSRLPGPLAGSLLADLGAEVVKVEFNENEDPFVSEDTRKREDIFYHWRKSLNENKKLVRLEKGDKKALEGLLENCDVILCPPSSFFAGLKSSFPQILFIEVMGGSGSQKYLHDLNALFLTKSFKLFLENETNPAPPYLPFAGIVFAQQIALEALAGHLEKRSNPEAPNKRVFLDQAAKNVLDKLWTGEMEKGNRTKFLHNGRFPCYNIYRSLDGFHIGLAAVEEKFWSKFTRMFNLALSTEDRYDESGKTGQTLKEMFLSYSASEILKRIGDEDICLNVFSKH